MNKFLIGFLVLCSTVAYTTSLTATIYSTYGERKELGQIVFSDTSYGLLIEPKLHSLPSGGHGFHLHQHADCEGAGMQAGGHYDPANTNSHQGPYGQGHLGDLPLLYVTEDGSAVIPTLAPRLKVSDLKGLAVIVHAGGDNYSNTPPLGGGGARIACGKI